MVPRLSCALLLALVGCAGGEDLTQGSGFGNSWPTTPTPGNTTPGQSSTTDPGTSTTTDAIRPDFGSIDSSSTGAEPTTDPDPTGVTATTTTTTGPTITCGDGVIEAPEECDGAELGGQTCMSLGFSGGTLSCASNCAFDKSQCVSESCGDGVKNGGEDCDCGQQGTSCTPEQLGAVACASLLAPSNGNYHGGTLTCGSPHSCVFNTSGCFWCGDGIRNGPESCEGGDLGGQTCAGLGFTGGTLACNTNCTHNTIGCFTAVCGDGQCNGNEDSCTCPTDCPDDPNMCSSCECGGFSGNCACDVDCIYFGDCCPNGPC